MQLIGRTPDLNPVRRFADRARMDPDRIAIVCREREHTSADADALVATMAGAFLERGLQPGTCVAYVGMNSDTCLIALLAAWRLGAVFVPINSSLTASALSVVLASSAPHILVCEDGHRRLADSVAAVLPEHCLLVDDTTTRSRRSPSARWEFLFDVLDGVSTTPPIVPLSFDDLAIVMFTSASATAQSKGVMLTIGNLWWNAINVDAAIGTTEDDITLAVAPLFGIGGLNAFTLTTLLHGGTVIVDRAFDVERTVSDLVCHRVNTFFAVPTVFTALAAHPDFFAGDLSALRCAVVAEAPMSPALIEVYAEHGISLQQAWGLTETSPFATHLPATHVWDKIGSAGLPMPYTEVRVVGAAPQPAGVAGELVVRGPNVTPGYWNDPQSTESAFDDDGWFHTGDVGYFDADGYLYVLGRREAAFVTCDQGAHG